MLPCKIFVPCRAPKKDCKQIDPRFEHQNGTELEKINLLQASFPASTNVKNTYWWPHLNKKRSHCSDDVIRFSNDLQRVWPYKATKISPGQPALLSEHPWDFSWKHHRSTQNSDRGPACCCSRTWPNVAIMIQKKLYCLLVVVGGRRGGFAFVFVFVVAAVVATCFFVSLSCSSVCSVSLKECSRRRRRRHNHPSSSFTMFLSIALVVISVLLIITTVITTTEITFVNIHRNTIARAPYCKQCQFYPGHLSCQEIASFSIVLQKVFEVFASLISGHRSSAQTITLRKAKDMTFFFRRKIWETLKDLGMIRNPKDQNSNCILDFSENHNWQRKINKQAKKNGNQRFQRTSDRKPTELFSNFSTFDHDAMGYNSFKFHVQIIFWEVTKNYQPQKNCTIIFVQGNSYKKSPKKKQQEKQCVQPVWWMVLGTRLQQLFSSQLLQDLRNLAISIHLQDPSSEMFFFPLGRRWEQVGNPEITNGLELGVKSSYVKLRYW